MSPLDQTLLTTWWHLVAHRSELAESGAFLRLDWALGDLVLHNDEGQIIAFDNVCPHRGARFFVEDHGVGRAVCPYHGWSYRGGQVRVPLAKTFPPGALDKVGLRRFQTAWCGDFLFVGIEPAQDLPTQLAGAFAPLAEVSTRIAGRRDFNAFEFQSDWRVAVENALESDHVNPVHPRTLAPLGLQDDAIVFDGPNTTYAAHITDSRTLRGLKTMGRFFEAEGAYRGYWTIYVFPFAMVSSTFGYSYSLQTFLPSATPHRAHFCSRQLAGKVKPGYEAAVAAFLDSSARVNRQIFDEDHAICARVSPHYDLTSADRVFSPGEARVARLHAILTAMTNQEDLP
ncbi:Rieske 2Fe-2S domain-containing protein [Caulobacter sp. FWC2]|uniref:Rieske 2Fe-2S domain-containing protein n=1 Tax=Caulobacter sp. FWC2 TaxID=69664 RepID=UPI001303FBE6|nr:Rieske 2Fe-2S domain-containing protein [Caulobacter sp. FWC2]